MSETTIPATGGERRGRARSPAVIERRQAALRQINKEARDGLTDAVQHWANYTDRSGKAPSQREEIYYQSFKRMIHGRLGISQTIDRDHMSRPQLMALVSMEEALTAVLNDGMARLDLRSEIKDRYVKALDALAEAHRPILKLLVGV